MKLETTLRLFQSGVGVGVGVAVDNDIASWDGSFTDENRRDETREVHRQEWKWKLIQMVVVAPLTTLGTFDFNLKIP